MEKNRENKESGTTSWPINNRPRGKPQKIGARSLSNYDALSSKTPKVHLKTFGWPMGTVYANHVELVRNHENGISKASQIEFTKKSHECNVNFIAVL